MNKLVSIIIPNYNNEKYIVRCLDSILQQTYENIEVIIIDDGSTDNSWNIINQYRTRDNFTIVKQYNMNASVARNKGIELSRGEYLFFLDSDDYIFSDAIEKMVHTYNEINIDLVIGDFCLVEENEKLIRKEKHSVYNLMIDNPLLYSYISPNPSNKLYKRCIIIDNGIYFGNVRIGQDLNFYMKYLLKCKNIVFIDNLIYSWRQVENGMSQTASLKIFDIVASFQDIKKFYTISNSQKEYDKYVTAVEFKHYCYQMEKQIKFRNYKMRKLIVYYFSNAIANIDIKKSVHYSQYKKMYIICKLKIFFKFMYTSELYRMLILKIKK